MNSLFNLFPSDLLNKSRWMRHCAKMKIDIAALDNTVDSFLFMFSTHFLRRQRMHEGWVKMTNFFHKFFPLYLSNHKASEQKELDIKKVRIIHLIICKKEHYLNREICFLLKNDVTENSEMREILLNFHTVRNFHTTFVLVWRIYCHRKNISSKQLFSNFFCKKLFSRNFCQKCVRLDFHNFFTVWENEKFSLTKSIFLYIWFTK